MRPALFVGILLKRQPVYYHWNYFLPLGMIGTLGGVALVVPAQDLSTRAQLILTLVPSAREMTRRHSTSIDIQFTYVLCSAQVHAY